MLHPLDMKNPSSPLFFVVVCLVSENAGGAHRPTEENVAMLRVGARAGSRILSSFNRRVVSVKGQRRRGGVSRVVNTYDSSALEVSSVTIVLVLVVQVGRTYGGTQ
jgi:hypothetical protein